MYNTYTHVHVNEMVMFQSRWIGIMHHIQNKHWWLLSHGDGPSGCTHGPLDDAERNKPWLNNTDHAVALQELRQIVFDKRFLNKVGYWLNFRLVFKGNRKANN